MRDKLPVIRMPLARGGKASREFAAYLEQIKQDSVGSPTYAGLTLTGLTASLPVVTDASKGLASKSYADFMAGLSGQAGAAFNLNSQNLTGVGTIGCGAITTTGNLSLVANSILGTSVDLSNADLQLISGISDTEWGYLGGATVAGGAMLDAADAAAQRTLLSVENGATADQTEAEILSLLGVTSVEVDQVGNIAATTISEAQWGYLGACGAGGGQLLAALSTGESTQLEAIGATTISATQWGYVGALDQDLITTSTVEFADIKAKGPWVDVRTFGTAGDGTTCDVVEIQAALDSLGATGGTVMLAPDEKYLINDDDLTIPNNCSLKGWDTGSGRGEGSKLIIDTARTIVMEYSAGISNLSIWREGLTIPEADESSFAGTAITITARDDVYVGYITILGFEYGIYATSNPGRLHVEEVRGDCKNGIFVDGSLDVVMLHKCHFWPFVTASHGTPDNSRTGSAYYIRNVNDWLKITDCFCYEYDYGFTIHGLATQPRNVILTGCGADIPGVYGFNITGDVHELLMTNCQGVATAGKTGFYFDITAGQDVTMVNCYSWGGGTKINVVAGDVSVIGGNIYDSSMILTKTNGGNYVRVAGANSANETAAFEMIDNGNYIKTLHGGAVYVRSYNAINFETNNAASGMILDTSNKLTIAGALDVTGLAGADPSGHKALYYNTTTKSVFYDNT